MRTQNPIRKFRSSNLLPPDDIVPGLYLGDISHARDRACLRSSQIFHVLNAAAEVDCFHKKDPAFKYCHLPIVDTDQFDIYQYYGPAILFIDNAIKSNQRVLVHCAAGVSRSACLVIAYLVARCNFTVIDALAHTKQRRPRIKPNRGFWNQLLRFAAQPHVTLDEPILRQIASSDVLQPPSLRSDRVAAATSDPAKAVVSIDVKPYTGSQLAEIVPNVFIGSGEDARDLELLIYYSISHVLNVADEIECYHRTTSNIIYLHVPIRGPDDADIAAYFPDAFGFINDAINNGGKVLIHSALSICRSPSVCIAYLTVHCNFTQFTAISHIKEHHPRTQPSRAYWKQLLRIPHNLEAR
uniref:protein-tyrosine-phosphatase n=1 Tax=Spongospora subterranea TaxID=70186 RepID=A0A0H5R747_9EUKA|eukprot:CRZ09955.1 hypothetical protein [Spongospora subterranea]